MQAVGDSATTLASKRQVGKCGKAVNFLIQIAICFILCQGESRKIRGELDMPKVGLLD